MSVGLNQLSSNLWKPSGAKVGLLKSDRLQTHNFASIGGDTMPEKAFLTEHGPIDGDAWKQSFLPKSPPTPQGKRSSIFGPKEPGTPPPAQTIISPLGQLLPGSGPDHPVLANGKPHQAFYANQSDQLNRQIAAAHPKPLGPGDPELLRRNNPVAYDRFKALSKAQQKHVTASGTPDNVTLFIPKSDSPAKGRESENTMRQSGNSKTALPAGVEEVFTSLKTPGGKTSVLGRRAQNGDLYLFGSDAQPRPKKRSIPAKNSFDDSVASWFAPQAFAEGKMPAREKPMDATKVVGDVGDMMEGPWRDYLRGPELDGREHGVQAVHASPKEHGFDRFLGQFNTAKGILETAKSLASSLKTFAELARIMNSLGQFGSLLGKLSAYSIPASPGALITSLMKGSGMLGPVGLPGKSGSVPGPAIDGIVVTTGGGAAALDGIGRLLMLGKTETGSGTKIAGKAPNISGDDGGSGKAEEEKPEPDKTPPESGDQSAGSSEGGPKPAENNEPPLPAKPEAPADPTPPQNENNANDDSGQSSTLNPEETEDDEDATLARPTSEPVTLAGAAVDKVKGMIKANADTAAASAKTESMIAQKTFQQLGEAGLESSGQAKRAADATTNALTHADDLAKAGKISKAMTGVGALLSAADQYEKTEAQTTAGQATSSVAFGGTMAALSVAAPPIAVLDAGMNLAGVSEENSPSNFYAKAIDGTVALGEGIMTGDTTGMMNVHQANLDGENGIVLEVAAKSGDYWAEHGLVGGIKNVFE